mmetsp:Transcript_20011/g.46176  ORF Transcript_20011/g.46176 Transcript_20011/m.46176 type:complete len:231 (-) Transcript_20011:519-1211(-)
MQLASAVFAIITTTALRFPAAPQTPSGCARAHPPTCLIEPELMPPEPRDELKRRFTVASGEATRTTFMPDSSDKAAVHELSLNEQLRSEIEAMRPTPTPTPPEKLPVDLNGIKPRDLAFGAFSYAIVGTLAWQFTNSAAAYFAEHPNDSSFYFVSRLTSLARVIVVSMGALGTGITTIASIGQAALAVQVAIGISNGELDPNKARVLPKKRKEMEIERLFALMSGRGKRI